MVLVGRFDVLINLQEQGKPFAEGHSSQCDASQSVCERVILCNARCSYMREHRIEPAGEAHKSAGGDEARPLRGDKRCGPRPNECCRPEPNPGLAGGQWRRHAVFTPAVLPVTQALHLRPIHHRNGPRDGVAAPSSCSPACLPACPSGGQ